MAKITVTTDKAGRKVYKVAGTKKYAYSMAKAKEIAGSAGGTAKRAPVKRATRIRGSAEEGWIDTKPLRRVKKEKPSAARARQYAAFAGELAHDVVVSLKGLASYKKAHAAFKKDAYKAAAKYGVNEDYVTPSFVRTVLRELKYEIDDLEGLRKPAKPKSAARKGTKKYSRQKTGRALYRTRRNPYDPSKRETSPGFLRLESEGALRLAHREQDEATSFGQEAAKYRFSENNVSRIVAEGKRDAALARAKAASLLRDAYLDAAEQAEKETSAYVISRK